MSFLMHSLNGILDELNSKSPDLSSMAVSKSGIYSLKPASNYLWNRFVSATSFINGQNKTVKATKETIQDLFVNDLKEAALLTYSLRLERISAQKDPKDDLKGRLKELFFKEAGQTFNEEDFEKCFNLINKPKTATRADQTASRERLIRNSYQIFFKFWEIYRKTPSFKEKLSPLVQEDHPLQNETLFKAIKKEYKLINLKALILSDLPTDILSKASFEKEEEKRLTEWIQSLNARQDSISPSLFYSWLKEISFLEDDPKTHLHHLITSLKTRGCQLFDQPYQKSLDRQRGFKEGDEIEWRGNCYHLGKEILEEGSSDRIFEIVEKPDTIVRIANNRIKLLVKECSPKNRKTLFGVRDLLSSDDFGIGSDPLFRFEQKLDMLNLKWETEDWRLKEEEEKQAFDITNHLFYWIDIDKTPKNFSWKAGGRDKEGFLRFIKTFARETGDYSKYESYALEAANGNLFVLFFFVYTSRLSKHPIREYFQERVKDYLESGNAKIETTPLPEHHIKDFYREQAHSVIERIDVINKACKTQLDDEHHKDLSKRLLDYYLEEPLVFCFDDKDLQEKVIKSFSEEGLSLQCPSEIEKKRYEEISNEIYELNIKIIREAYKEQVGGGGYSS